MSPKYDLFERFADGSSLWRASVIGLEVARLHMRDLGGEILKSVLRDARGHRQKGRVPQAQCPETIPASLTGGESVQRRR